jgi:signal recognition particle subunit SRP54
LLDADVNLIAVKDFIKNIRQKAIGTVINHGEDPEQILLTIIKDELVNILGQKTRQINTEKHLIKIMMVGLQGSGKTTTVAKLANFLIHEHHRKPLLVALDIYRPAAIDQLQTLADQIHVDFYQHGNQNTVLTADEAMAIAAKNNNDVIIFDTAGRLQTNKELMDELVNIRNKVSPDEILMVVDAMSGQDVMNVANEFNNHLSLSGFVITKLDSDAKAGAALSLAYLLHIPIMYMGTGEKVGSLDVFYPERMADRILGLGDILTLAEKANKVVDENKAKKSLARMLAGKMDLEDLMQQMSQLSKMGSFGSVAKMMPNAPKISEDQISQAEQKMKI